MVWILSVIELLQEVSFFNYVFSLNHVVVRADIVRVHSASFVLIRYSCIQVVICGWMVVNYLRLPILNLLLLELLVHDDSSHLLLHLDHSLRIEKTVSEVKNVFTLHKEGHKASLIWLCEKMWLNCLYSKWLVAVWNRVSICACNSTVLIKWFKTALVLRFYP